MPTLRLFAKTTMDAKALALSYNIYTYQEESADFQPGAGVNTIHFYHGELIIDGQRIAKPYFGHDMVTWSQKTNGHYTSGYLYFRDNGINVHGAVCRGKDEGSATVESVIGTAITPVPYTTQITAASYPPNTDPSTLPASAWGTGLSLSIGFEQAIGTGERKTVVLLDGQDISESVAWSIDQSNQKTVLALNVDPVACQFDSALYLEGSVEFDIFQPLPTFSGTLTSTCADQTTKGVYFWKGTSQKAMSGMSAPQAAAFAAPVTEDQLLAMESLHITELVTIIPDQTVSDQANALLVENMKWAMAQDDTEKNWLTMFFGETPPVLSPDQKQVAQKSLGWYQKTFSKAYLGWATTNYTGPNAPDTNLNDDQKLKLKYFLQTGMAKDPDFNVQQNGIFLEAFIEAKPRLQAFLSDTASNWAQQLYDCITQPGQFVQMVNRVWFAAGQEGAMAQANNWATLLSVLQPSGELAKHYIQSVLTGTLYDSVHQISNEDSETVMEWLPQFLQTFLDQAATRGNVPDSAKIAAQQMREMLAEMGGDITKLAQELSGFLVVKTGKNITQATQEAADAFAKKWPKFAALGKALFLMAWCMGVVQVVKAFQNWSTLKPEDKARAIVTVVNLGFQALEVVPEFILGVKDMGLAGWNKLRSWWCSRQPQDEQIELQEIEGADWVANGAEETTALLGSTAASPWKALGMASKVVAVVGIVVSAAFAVLSTIDFVNDIKSGAPIAKTVLDGISMAANIATTVCMVIGLIVANVIFAIAAAVLAIVGIIISIIESLVVKPPNPLETFMTDVVVPFVTAMPVQTPPPGGTKNLVVVLA